MRIISKNGDMVRAIKECKKNAVIAEIKVYSPKHGDLLKGRDEIEILRAYEKAGAAGISYITEASHFNGDFKVFKKICSKSELPVLRKDFILSKHEIERTAEAEASAILLIARKLGEKTAEFVDYSLEHGLDTLVEVHNASEIEIAEQTKAAMIGINNRDISKLEVDDGDVSLTEKLARLIPANRILISESGISSVEDLRRALKHADAVLVGTAFMKAKDIEKVVKSFVEAEPC
jgi:indole-3-glycerol phosphate synthase